ncbi:zinc finger protein 34 isoform X1 [Plutella xylostella]|uniref:zinc finger protein 34 isoform X1 n=2 Tax=Plutella xylostella TaxID=51655 RepID=UPI002032E6C3|nr:zinc finger protein 34 isoform X1 [Plutella xylostella]
MANVKSRLKSSPEKKTGTRGRPKKQKVISVAPKVNMPCKDTGPEAMIVTKKKESPKVLTVDEKVSIFLQNGKKLKQNFVKPLPGVKDGKIDKSQLGIVKEQLVSKSGKLKATNRDHLRLMDKLLMSELMITEVNSKRKKLNSTSSYISIESDKFKGNDTPSKSEKDNTSPKKKKSHPSSSSDQSIDNNNTGGISDQNKSESESSPGSSPKKEKQKKGKQNTKPKKAKKITNISKKLHDDSSKKISKLKQVTLSNGVVLRLSLYQCDYCQKTFTNKSSLRRHIYMHMDIKPYGCMHCSKRFRQRCNLQVHQTRRHVDKYPQKFMCNQCDKPFLLKENLLLHLTSHVKNENSFRCVVCDKRFSHHLLLVQHEKQHLVSGRFQCSICSMSYDCRSRLSLHVKSHLNIKEFVCQYCGKEFLRPNSMRRHVEICHGGQTIQCPICRKRLKGHLTEHLRTHDNKRPHECPDCGQRFTQSTQLTVHRRSHTGARPYPCRICRRPFTHSNAMMLHHRRHTGEKPFSCPMCPMAFSQLPHMKAHMMKIHGKAMTYKCERCRQFFKLKSELEEHEKACAPPPSPPDAAAMPLPRMRFLLALLLTMIASKDKLKCLGFNKRLIDDLLDDSLKAMGQTPCVDQSLSTVERLKTNIQLLLNGTVPEDQMAKFRQENKSTEELLVLLTDEKKK